MLFLELIGRWIIYLPSSTEQVMESLREKSDSIAMKLDSLAAREEILDDKISFLELNRDLSNEANIVSLNQLQATLQYFEAQLMEISKEKLKIEYRSNKLKDQNRKLTNQRAVSSGIEYEPNKDIVIKVFSKREIDARFEISYLVEKAGWFPNYDLRVDAVSKPLQLIYKASVFPAHW